MIEVPSLTKVQLEWLLVYRGGFDFIFETLGNSRKRILFRDILRCIFLFYHEHVCCVYSLESPDRGDSNERTQHTIIYRMS